MYCLTVFLNWPAEKFADIIGTKKARGPAKTRLNLDVNGLTNITPWQGVSHGTEKHNLRKQTSERRTKVSKFFYINYINHS